MLAGAHPDLLVRARGGPSSCGGSPSTSRVPAGISRSSRSTAPRYWRTRSTVVVVGHGHHGHRAGMADDVAGERACRRGRRRRPRTREMRQPTEPDVSPRSRNPRAGPPVTVASVTGPRGQETAPTSASMSMRRGRRPSARARAAASSSRNSGWGRSGRLLNSGWAWVPTQKGWSGSSTNSTSTPVGRDARADAGRPPRARRGSGGSPRSGGGGARTPRWCRRPRPPGTRDRAGRRRSRAAWCRPCRRRRAARP